MKRGFTILELLVASMLLGMLMIVLTMIFSQSSISWRIGQATVADLGQIVKDAAVVRKDADNYYLWKDGSEPDAVVSLWDSTGNLRSRTLASLAENTKDYEKLQTPEIKAIQSAKGKKIGHWGLAAAGSGDSGGSAKNYTINVMSAGPNRTFGDWDDIWSFPDEFD